MSSRPTQSTTDGDTLSDVDLRLAERVAGSAATVADFAKWITSAVQRGHLAEAGERLKSARARWVGVDWAPLETRISMMGRDYQNASALIAKALLAARDPQDEAFLRDLKSESDLLQSISDRMRSRGQSQADDLAVYVVNLDENPDRWDRISWLTHPHPLRRVPGVPARYLADGLMKRFGPQVSPSFKGTLGCFLAHYAAWEAHIKSGDAYALVLEDDCLPLVDLPRNAAALALPEEADVGFFTTALGRISAADRPAHADLTYRPLAGVVRALGRGLQAPGGYGYLLTRRGAEQLVARVDADGFYGDVDWRMIAYCVTNEDLDQVPRDSFSHGALTAHLQVLAERPPLNGVVCQPGLIRPGQIGSVRVRDDALRHTHLHADASDRR